MREDIIQLGREAHRLNARTDKANVQATDIILDKRALGWTYQRIADHLHTKYYLTRRGCAFTPAAVLRLARAADAYAMAA